MRKLPHYAYRILWSERDGECVAVCDELPELSGLGATPTAAIRQLETAIAPWLDYLAAHGIGAPVPARRSAR